MYVYGINLTTQTVFLGTPHEYHVFIVALKTLRSKQFIQLGPQKENYHAIFVLPLKVNLWKLQISVPSSSSRQCFFLILLASPLSPT